MVVLPDCATLASEHGGTTIVSGVCCLGITTVRTPGFCRAADTGSWLELEELLLEPHAVIAAPTAPAVRMPAARRAAAHDRLVISSSSGALQYPRQLPH
jgi:hypothetical protein